MYRCFQDEGFRRAPKDWILSIDIVVLKSEIQALRLKKTHPNEFASHLMLLLRFHHLTRDPNQFRCRVPRVTFTVILLTPDGNC